MLLLVTKTVTDISKLVPTANASGVGDTIVLADGTYNHASREAITRSGVIVKAANKHKAIIKGAPIDLKATNVEFSGFDLQYSVSSGDYIRIDNAACKLLDNKIHFANNATGKWIVVNDPDITITGNEIYNKTTMDTFITVNDAGVKIQNNYFHDLIGGGATPNEAIRIGASSVASKDFRSDVSGNTFERIKAEAELITIKSCNNNIHDNIFRDNTGSPTFRHGRNNKFVNNKLEGTGLRLYGKGHIVTGNTFKRNPNTSQLRQIVIGNGQYAEEEQNTTAGYTQVRDLVFQNNHIDMQDSTDLIIFCFGYGSYTLKPTANKIIGNTITASKGTLAQTTNGASWAGNTLAENIFWPVPNSSAKLGNMPPTGFTVKDPNAVTPPPTPTPEPEPTPTPPPVEMTLEEQVADHERRIKALENA